MYSGWSSRYTSIWGGMDMDVVWVDCQGVYRKGTDMDVVKLGEVSGYIQDG